MIKYINEVTRELGIEHHTLRNWEDKGYLGIVERDFTHGRMYMEEQIERIKVIQQVVKEQQERGMKRTDFKEVERVLLERFGGMIEEKVPSIPATPEVFTNMVLKMEKQDQQIQQLQQMVWELTNIAKQIPSSVDHTNDINEIKENIEGVMTKTQGEELLSKLVDKEKREKDLKNEVGLLKEKLDIAVDYIQRQENEEKKKGFFKRLFS
ncbi:MAG: MerR family transcriptional regulator [Bacillus sp. (in: firmicutes)]